jgi:hypothetical protein
LAGTQKGASPPVARFQDFLHVFLGVLVKMGLGRWACFWEFFRISFMFS